MASFEDAVAIVLRHEGGFVNNPNDPGGATNRGVTQRVLSEFLQRPATVDDVKNMSVETAKQIYKTKYWAAVQGDQVISQEVANYVMDMAVLRGTSGAIQTAQTAAGVFADGVMGTKTLAALNGVVPALFLNCFRALCQQRFVAICVGRPASLEFLPAWTKRAEEMAQVVNALWQKNAAQGR